MLGIDLMIKIPRLLRMSAVKQALALAAIFILILLLAGVVMQLVVQSNLEREIENDLSKTAVVLSEKLTASKELSVLTPYLESNRFTGQIVGFMSNDASVLLGEFKADVFDKVGIRDISEYRLFYDVDEENSNLEHSERRVEDDFEYLEGLDEELNEETDDQQYYWRVLVVSVNAGYLAVAAPLDEISLIEGTLPFSLMITGTLMAVITLVGGLLFGLVSQRRMLRIEKGLNQIAGGDLSVRFAPVSPKDDFDQLMLNIDDTTARLEQLMGEVKSLSVNLAHELRTPLARLRASLEREMLKGNTEASAFEMALVEVDRIEAIFDTVMRIAGMSAGKSRHSFTTLSLADLSTEIVEIFQPVIEESGRELLVEIEVPSNIKGDASAIIQAVGNLLQNAMVHTPQGLGICLTVRGAMIAVADQGTGIAESEREKVLQPMYRLERSRTTAGTGLGLAFVNAVADLHRAEVRLNHRYAKPPYGLVVSIDFSGNLL